MFKLDSWTWAYLVITGLFCWWGFEEPKAFMAALFFLCLGVLNELFAKNL